MRQQKKLYLCHLMLNVEIPSPRFPSLQCRCLSLDRKATSENIEVLRRTNRKQSSKIQIKSLEITQNIITIGIWLGWYAQTNNLKKLQCLWFVNSVCYKSHKENESHMLLQSFIYLNVLSKAIDFFFICIFPRRIGREIPVRELTLTGIRVSIIQGVSCYCEQMTANELVLMAFVALSGAHLLFTEWDTSGTNRIYFMY